MPLVDLFASTCHMRHLEEDHTDMMVVFSVSDMVLTT